nr:CotH kinase family protein [Geomicrobium sp. JCM 19055]
MRRTLCIQVTSCNEDGNGSDQLFLQLFDTDGNSTFTQHAGVRIHAETDSSVEQKSLRLYARDDYGEARFQYPFFGSEERNQFNRLVLHNGDRDWERTLLHDPFLHDLTRNLNYETQRSQSVNLYLNGEYWGIYHLRERYDSHYFRFAQQVIEKDLDLLEGDGTAIEGKNEDYKHLLAYIREYGAESDESYHYIATQIDIDNFIDFYIAQIYAANTEWKYDDLYYWRERPYGKWQLAFQMSIQILLIIN